MDQLIFAHRGASGRYAEHTRAAFLQALADGADGVECDVRLSRDEQPVCIHDDTLDRTSDGTGDVWDYTVQELRAFDFSSWKGAAVPVEYGAPSEQFMTLADVLDLLAEDGREIRLAIELKHPSPSGLLLEEKVLELLLERGFDPAASRLGAVQVSFMSFSPDSCRRMLELVPPSAVCQLVADVEPEQVRERVAAGPLGMAALVHLLRMAVNEGEALLDSGAAGVAGPGVEYVRDHQERIRSWIDAGLVQRVWTVDSADDLAFLQDLGVQEITTNHPAEMLALLGRGVSAVRAERAGTEG